MVQVPPKLLLVLAANRGSFPPSAAFVCVDLQKAKAEPDFIPQRFFFRTDVSGNSETPQKAFPSYESRSNRSHDDVIFPQTSVENPIDEWKLANFILILDLWLRFQKTVEVTKLL